MFEIPTIIQEIINIVKYEFGINFNEDSVYFFRFITHLKFFAQRLVEGNDFSYQKDDGLLDVIKQRYHNSYNCAEKVSKFIFEKYHYKVSDEEKMYLAIHIERVVYKAD